MTTPSPVIPLDDGHSHPTGPRPKLWADIGGTALYANGVVVQPFSGGAYYLGIYSVDLGKTIKGVSAAPSLGGVWVLFDDLTDQAVAFVNGVKVDSV